MAKNSTKEKLTKKQLEFVRAARSVYGNEIDKLSRESILQVCEDYDLKEPQWLIKPSYRVPGERGVYYIPQLEGETPALKKPSVNKTEETTPPAAVVEKTLVKNLVSIGKKFVGATEQAANSLVKSSLDKMIPKKDKNYVRFGIYSDLKTIIASKQFYPVFISGLSGNGKSVTPEQICAEQKREFIRVNIQKSTNEDDLLGGFRLINGETIWFDGPVVQAAERGAILLLDEIDYGSAEISCLQNVLEGKPFLIKKINRIVVPAEGFNIIATANTKGQGDNVGKFVFTNVLNEAFLERFATTLEQDYPPTDVEEKILMNNFESLEIAPETYGDFHVKLVKWANTNRETYKNGGINEVIATRRLVHIIKAFGMFGKRVKAVEICLNRFDKETKESLLDLYKKIDAAPVDNKINKAATQVDPDDSANKKPVADPDGGIPF
jgi:hypothetical protein